MIYHRILGYTNPIGSECSPLITIILSERNQVMAQFPDSSIKPLAIKEGGSYKDIKGIILTKKDQRISSEEYSYMDHRRQIHTLSPDEMLNIISEDLKYLKGRDEELYELLEFFFLQEKESLNKESHENSETLESEIIPVLYTRKKSQIHKREVIIRPIITEKTEKLSTDVSNPKFTFVVDKKANKIEIVKAVELFFGVNVKKVNTSIMPAKTILRNTRSGIIRGRKSGYKKATVTLNQGESIDFFGGLNLGNVA